jgi:hypothetical protein
MKKILIALMITSCGQKEKEEDLAPVPVVTEIAPALEAIVGEFMQYCQKYNRSDCVLNYRFLKSVNIVDSVTTSSGEKVPSAMGMCSTYRSNKDGSLHQADVQIKRTNYSGEKWKESEFKGLVFHELAHCLLLAPHSSSVGFPDLMNPSMWPNSMYVQNLPEMIDRVFKRTNVAPMGLSLDGFGDTMDEQF